VHESGIDVWLQDKIFGGLVGLIGTGLIGVGLKSGVKSLKCSSPGFVTMLL